MPRTKRKASSFPPSFQKTFLQVANTSKPVVVKNLGNKREPYTTLRARLNEFRRIYHEEAIATGDDARITIAEQMYAVTCSNPQKVDGQWQLMIHIKEFQYEDALQELLDDDVSIGEVEEDNAKVAPESTGARSIIDVMGGDES